MYQAVNTTMALEQLLVNTSTYVVQVQYSITSWHLTISLKDLIFVFKCAGEYCRINKKWQSCTF